MVEGMLQSRAPKIIVFFTLSKFFFFLCFACPYKNYEENQLEEQNFYQSVKFQRNFLEEERGASFGFQFWIFNAASGNPQVLSNFKNPYILNPQGNDDGNLILTIDEDGSEKFLIYYAEPVFYAKNLDDLAYKALDIEEDSWCLVLIQIKPISNTLIIELKRGLSALIFKLNHTTQMIDINLGGMKKVRGIYNLNSFKGRLTKLKIIDYLYYNENRYEDFYKFCLVPSKFIQSFGVYSLNKTSCRIGCLVCNFDECVVRDEEFKGFFYDEKGMPAGCQLQQYVQVDFWIKNTMFFYCVDWRIIHPQVEIVETATTSYFNCLFGYFDAIQDNNHFCIQCPFETSKRVECIECLLQNNEWYKKPICKSDFIFTINITSQLLERSEENYDLFIIDKTNQLIHQIGVQDFCTETQKQDCFLLKQKHIGEQVYVKCKQKYYQDDGICVFQNENCVHVIEKNNCDICKEGSYLYENMCYKCQDNCKTCIYSEENQKAKCITCMFQSTFIQNQCQLCGLFCLQCIEEYDKINKQYFSRCQRCIDDSKYFFSFDGTNCLENKISNCQYAFQALKNNISIQTLDYQFQRQLNQDQIEILCSRCFDFYVFVFPLKKCLKNENDKCIFGYAMTVFDSDNLGENTSNILLDDNNVVRVDKVKCLIDDQQDFRCVEIPNCLKCQYQQFNNQYICLTCSQGYYSDRFSHKCYLCPSSLFCDSCHQENLVLYDYWKTFTRPFYLEFIEQIYAHRFIQHSQSQLFSDYDIVCDKCQGILNLKNNKCKRDCIVGCLVCEVNDKNICTKCVSSMILIDGECFDCQHSSCLLCKKYSNQEALQQNPYYFIGYILKCFKQKNNYNYYDQEINQFLQCNIFQSGCEKHLIIKYILPNKQLKKLTARERGSFDQPNFEYFSYQVAQLNLVKKVIQKFESTKSMIFKVNQELIFDQEFSKYVFTAKNVEIEINCFHEVIWEISQSLIFDKYSKLKFNGLIIKVMQSKHKKNMKFQSLFQQQIIFQNVIFLSEVEQSNQFQLIFFNITSLNFINTTFENFQIQNGASLFLIHNTNFMQKITFFNIIFFNIQLSNSSIVRTEGDKDDLIFFFKNTSFIQGKIIKSSIIMSNNENLNGILDIFNFTIQNIEIKSCSSFILLSTFIQVNINRMQMINLSITDSNMIQLGQKSNIINFELNSCLLISKTIIIKNVDYLGNQSFDLTNLSFQLNNYSKFSKFLYFNQNNYFNSNSELLMKNVTIQNNILNSQDYDIDLMNKDCSLIFLQLDKISISEIQLIRSFGLNDFTFENVKLLSLKNLFVTQGLNYRLKGIHEYFECFNQTIKCRLYGISFFISSSIFIEIKNITISFIQSFDYPIIFFMSDNVASYEETLIFSSITLENSLLIQTLPQTQSSLILIESNQFLKITVSNSVFNSNILKVYCPEARPNSAVLFNINAQKSNLFLKSSIFAKNIVLNSQASIFYIRSNSIIIEDCKFNENNQFIYEVIQPYLLWTFNENEIVLDGQIQNLMKIESLYGLGFFILEKIKITKSIFQVCQGLNAFIFIIVNGKGNIWLDQLQFFSNDYLIESNSQMGSVMFFDSTLSEILDVNINNVEARKIYSTEKGGMFYFNAGQGNTNVSLNNCNISDVAYSGSLIYFQNIYSKNKEKIIKLENFEYAMRNNRPRIEQNEAIISISNASFAKIQEARFYGQFQQNLIVIKNTNFVQLISILISESFFNERIFYIIPDQANNGQFIFQNVKIVNATFEQIQFYNQQERIISSPLIQYRCTLKKNLTAPFFLGKFNQSDQPIVYNNFSAVIDKSQQIYHGVAQFDQLNEFHQLKIDNVELKSINCSFCANGLLSINFNPSQPRLKKQEITNIFITNSSCGVTGCFKLFTSSIEYFKNGSLFQFKDIEFVVQGYICQFNFAVNGTCFNLENIRILIQKSNFRYNNASGSGGTIYSKQSKYLNEIIIEDSIIENNFAYVGGGIFMEGQQELNFEKLDSIVTGNQAMYFANDISAIPSKLQLDFGHIQRNSFETYTLISNDTYLLQIQKLKIQALQYGLKSNYPLLPNGIPLSQYHYFDWKNRIYVPLNFTLKILALTGQGVEIKNLNNSYCKIKSRIRSLSDEKESQDDGKHTSFTQLDFDKDKQNYYLDNIIIYKREDWDDQEILELEFWCSSIFVPIYNKNYPFNLISQHNQYFLRLQIKTYPCQLGEIKNTTVQSCQSCKSEAGFFQLKLNQTSCQLRDEVSTIEVQPALLNLRAGYWRPYFDTSWISECTNEHQNCKGGWIEGDTSCMMGHIGALCEKCDIDNIRGDDQFSQTQQYSCQKCQRNSREYVQFFLSMLWTFISISISASGNLSLVNERVQALRLQKIGFQFYISQNSRVLLVKILNNNLQVLNSIYTTQMVLIWPARYLFIFTNQTTLPYFIDCLLSQISAIEIQYFRMIISLSLPLIYFTLFYWMYGTISLCQKLSLNKSFLSTTLIYLYIYFSPMLARELIYLLSYRYISGYYWISSNIAYRYDTLNHIKWMLYFCVPSLSVVVLLIPSYLFSILYMNRLRLDQKKIRQMLGFLYNEFKKNAYFWEIVRILEKIALIFFFTFYEQEINITGGMQLLILIFYQVISLEYKPYLTKKYNKLDLLSNQVMIFSITLSIGIIASQKYGLNYLNFFFQCVLVIINLHFFTKIIVQILVQYLEKYQKYYYYVHDYFREIILRLFPNSNEISILKSFFNNHKQRQIRTEYLFSQLRKYVRQEIKINRCNKQESYPRNF